MLIKEYRIPLPLTVEEYRIAQLYMIAKKSREESKGTESGVEILVNEPYSDGPGGSGQFTHKIYHVGSHLPGWFKSLLPKSALTVEEEAWNAYPYTKTRFKCPFVEKFSLEIETYYTPDGGDKENVFNLSESEKRSRIVDLIDVVKDQEGSVYEDPEKEDPTLFTSEKTRRGPLSADWLEEFSEACRGQQQPTKDGKAIMCAYKLCKVEFRYWGMQSKIERFIHDVALRKTMLKAHSQAWTWQDEWFGLTMEDIRAIEKETAEMLRKTMGGGLSGEEGGDEGEYRAGFDLESSAQVEVDVSGNNTTKAQFSSIEYSEADVPKILSPKPARVRKSDGNEDNSEDGEQDDEEEEDDEFFDAREQWEERVSLAKWSSMDFENADLDLDQRRIDMGQDEPMINFRRAQSMHEKSLSTPLDRGGIPNMPMSARPHSAGLSAGGGRMQPVIDINRSSEDYCPTQVLILVMHGGSVLDGPMDPSVRKSDVTTFRGAFETIIRNHYPGLLGQVAIKCVPCPAICTEALAVLSSLSPYSFDVIPSLNNIGQQEDFVVSNDRLPIGTIPIFATSSPDYHTSVNKVANSANQVFADFLNSEEGQGFCGQVVLIGDSMGAILAYDALCHSQIKRSSSDGSVNDNDHLHHHRNRSQSGESRSSSPKIDSASESHQQHQNRSRHLSIRKDHVPLSSSTSTSTQVNEEIRFDFDVSDFFAFGSPLGMLLAYRKLQQTHSKGTGGSALHHNKLPIVPRPNIQQMYNLFHPTDPLTCRIEPLLSAPFSGVPPVNVSRYQTYPMGDGACYSLIEFIQGNTGLFSEGLSNPHRGFPGHHHHHHQRRASEESIISGVVDSQQLHTINVLKPKWWGGRRIDYALYCPEGLSNFPTNSLPHLFHSSFWESADVISFVLRQLVRCHDLVAANPGAAFSSSVNPGLNVSQMLEIDQPREKWMKKRTSVKIRNGAPNHRGNDVIVKEGNRQVLSGRFSYGPLDMAALTGEKVDVHLMKDPSKGDWTIITTEMTDKHGRLAYTLPPEHVLGYGVYPIRMVVRGDHTCLYMTLAVVPPKTECVVFSIDGSFAASMSVTGKDPKVKPGAVDIVRHWLDLGYLIVYVTARPDMQMQRVVAWLTQHNFPKGLVSFADGFTTDPLRHKADYLKSLMQEQEINIHAAYGSSKDINVYSTLGLKNEEMYIIGKPSRRQSQLPVNWIANGYTEHLANLNTPGGSRPAQGNARMVIPKGAVLGNPVHAGGLQRRRTFKATAARTSSYPYGAPPDSSQPSAAPGTT